MGPVQIKLDSIEDDSNWVTGKAIRNKNEYEFYAKVSNEKEKISIEKGRVTKLTIRLGKVSDEIEEKDFWSEVVANYDRDWITKPINAEAVEIFYAILDELETMPLYEERIYGGSKIKKLICKTRDMFNFERNS